MSTTEKFVNYARELRFNDIPADTVDHIKIHILDTIGATLVGSAAEGSKNLLKLVTGWGGAPEGTIFVFGNKVPLPNAVWMNSTMSRGFDYETMVEGATHVSASIVPAAFGLSEYCTNTKNKLISGKDFITAVTLGIDLNKRFRIANKMMGGGRGWLAETFSPPAIAAMGSKLMNFDKEKTGNAIGIAYNQCCGNYGSTTGTGGGLMAQVSQGMRTKAGILSVLLADNGFTAYQEIIDGKYGLFNMYADGTYDQEKLIGQLGKKYELKPIVKRYPGCGATQPSIHGILGMVKENQIDVNNIQKVVIKVGESNYGTCGNKQDKPLTTADALWHYKYSSAVALARGKVFVNDFTSESINNLKILNIAKIIEVTIDNSLKSEIVILITTRNGKTYEKKATGIDPMPIPEVQQKVRDCNLFSAKPLSEQKVEHLIQMINNLDKLDNVTKIINIIS